MRINPVVRPYRANYPTREVLDAHPELLRRLPNRWQGNVAIAATVAAAGALIAAQCRTIRADSPPEGATLVAPLFLHGEGRGSFMNPATELPQPITEDEGRQIILDELKDTGLTLQPDAQTITNTPIPITSPGGRLKTTKPGDLVLDLADQTKHVALEYVSIEHYKVWSGGKDRDFSLMNGYDIRGAAQLLRDGLATTAPAGAYGVFYDPIRYPDADDQDALRAQVKDFIVWLKAEGVI